MSIKDDMNSSAKYLPTKWTRRTVADGDWLQANTIKPLSARDEYLADKIDELSGGYDDKIEVERIARKYADAILSGTIDSFSGEFNNFKSDVELSASILSGAIIGFNEDLNNEELNRIIGDNLLSAQIENLKTATDVIAVFGTHSQFVAASSNPEWQQTVTDNDFIKILNDETVSSNQVYYEWHDPNAVPQHTDWSGWSAVFDLDPYYTQAQTRNLIADGIESISSVIANYYLSANRDAVSAGKNIVVTNENGPVIGIKTSADVEFTTLNGQNVNNIIGSAQSGQFAWDVINSAEFSAIGTTTNTAYLSGGFGIEAGSGVGVSLNGKNIVITAEGTTYDAGSYISTANKRISVTEPLIGSAESGKLAYDYLTNSASFYAGPGISFYSAGQNLLGISAEGQAFVSGRCIAIGQNNSINLSSDIDVDNITATQKLYLSGNNDGKYSTATFTYSSVDLIKYGQPCPELHFNAAELSATGAIGNIPVTKSIKWYDVANMNDKFMFVEPNAVGSTLEANTAIKIVVTSSLPAPNQMEDNTYYIV